MASKQVCFLIGIHQSTLGSVYLRSRQLRDLASVDLMKAGYDSFVSDDISTLSDCIVIVSKSALMDFNEDQIAELSKKNTLIVDPLDLEMRAININVFHFLMSCSKQQTIYFREAFPEKATFYIPHHVDLRIVEHRASLNCFKAAYFGANFNCRYLREISDKIEFFSVWQASQTDWISNLGRFNAHYAIRENQSFDGFKPFTKGFVAASQGSVVIISRDDKEAMLHVGDSYPFSYDINNAADARNAIDDANESFATGRWHNALDVMEGVRLISSSAHVGETFTRMIKEVA